MMKEITEQNLINFIKNNFPKFPSYWQAYTYKRGVNAGIGDDIEPFLEYIVDKIKSENYDEVELIFNFIEFLICNGDELIQIVVEKCLLVPLLFKDPNEIQFTKFSKYLGKETIDFLKRWNQIEGTQTEGI